MTQNLAGSAQNIFEDPEDINLKEELSNELDFDDIIVTEYLEEDANEEGQDDEEEDKLEDFIKIESKEPKKLYKRALCGLCGKNYYKDQLQRHIDVSRTSPSSINITNSHFFLPESPLQSQKM